MKVKRITALLLALTLTVTLSACGNVEPTQESTENEVETEESEEIEAKNVEEEKTEIVKNDSTETALAQQTSAPTPTPVPAQQTPAPTPTPVPAQQTPAPTPTPAPAQQTSAPTLTPVPAQSTPASTPAPTATPEPVATPAPTATPAPVHEHSWKEHTVTTQVWVPNIVVVDDYQTMDVKVGEWYNCNNCVFRTDDPDVIREHVYATYHSFTIEPKYEAQHVCVGSHEEDHGHYETSTYVDYYYCDCGERK